MPYAHLSEVADRLDRRAATLDDVLQRAADERLLRQVVAGTQRDPWYRRQTRPD